jgi:hypothetical protein
MKHFAVVGFFVALLTVRVNAQVLFNVTANPDLGTISITAEPNVTVTIPQGFPTKTVIDEETQLPKTVNLNSSSDGFTLMNLFKNPYTAGNSVQVSGTSGLKVDNETFTGQPSSGEISNPFPSQVNKAGLNFDLFTVGPGINLTAGTVLEFTGTVVFSNFTTFTSASFDTSQTLSVYGGLNNAYDGNSFLGTYTLTVVPEPSTYAAIAGGLGLAAAVIHRRRQRAKAAQG